MKYKCHVVEANYKAKPLFQKSNPFPYQFYVTAIQNCCSFVTQRGASHFKSAAMPIHDLDGYSNLSLFLCLLCSQFQNAILILSDIKVPFGRLQTFSVTSYKILQYLWIKGRIQLYSDNPTCLIMCICHLVQHVTHTHRLETEQHFQSCYLSFHSTPSGL